MTKEEFLKKLKKQARYIGGKGYPYAVVDIRELEKILYPKKTK